MHPQDSAPLPPPGPLTCLCGVTIVNFLEIHMRLPAAKWLFRSVRGPNQVQPSQQGPLEWVGAQSNSKRGPFGDYGDPWHPRKVGPFGLVRPYRKIPSTSMHMIICDGGGIPFLTTYFIWHSIYIMMSQVIENSMQISPVFFATIVDGILEKLLAIAM